MSTKRERYVIGWHGQLVDDVQETGGWAWLRMNELLWRRWARRVVRWLLRVIDWKRRTTDERPLRAER